MTEYKLVVVGGKSFNRFIEVKGSSINDVTFELVGQPSITSLYEIFVTHM